jgi:ribosome-binding protein aMBF1 (putative translation factor)
MDNQDWTPVVVRRGGGGVGGRGRGGAGPQRSPGAALLRHLEDDDAAPTAALKHLSSDSRTEMIRARTTKAMSQTQLNTACAFPHNTIRDIENGKLCPTPTQLNALKRALGVVMRYA